MAPLCVASGARDLRACFYDLMLGVWLHYNSMMQFASNLLPNLSTSRDGLAEYASNAN